MSRPSIRWLPAVLAVLVVASGLSAAEKRKGGGQGEKLDEDLPPGLHTLAIGDPAPDFSLPGVDGRTYTLTDFKEAPVLMVVFLSNHCPYSHAAESRLKPFFAEYKDKGLAVVAINPNSPDAVRVDELGYSAYNDSFPEMKLYAKDQGFLFPYLYDGDTQAVAKAYGCLCTPHVFIFDARRKLRYAGRFDDSRFAGTAAVTSPDARNAVDALLAGKPVALSQTRPFGCSTKWISKRATVATVDEAWTHAPVTLEDIDAAGVAALVRNDTPTYRLINVWATWCAPCTEEFPALVSLSRRLGNRDFEFISISMDEPAQKPKALAFLTARHAAMPNRTARLASKEGRSTNNYLFTGAQADALAKVLDPDWPGPLPETVLVAPGGKIVWRHTGALDLSETTKKLYEVLGAYYQ
jgi:peroxiredoxin